MKASQWDEFYDSFYDWSESTQMKYARQVASYGPACEVWEIAQELLMLDEKAGCAFLERALRAGVRFSPEQVLEAADLLFEEPLLTLMAGTADRRYCREELETLEGCIDEGVWLRLARRDGILPEEQYAARRWPPRKGPGLLTALTLGCIGTHLLEKLFGKDE